MYASACTAVNAFTEGSGRQTIRALFCCCRLVPCRVAILGRYLPIYDMAYCVYNTATTEGCGALLWRRYDVLCVVLKSVSYCSLLTPIKYIPLVVSAILNW